MYHRHSVYQQLYTVCGDRYIVTPHYETFRNDDYEVEPADSIISTPQIEVGHWSLQLIRAVF